MTLTPHSDVAGPDFPGDPSPQPPFGFRDSVRSSLLWAVGLSQMAGWGLFVQVASRLSDFRRIDFTLKWMAKSIPTSIGVDVKVRGRSSIDPSLPYVYVSNHVNIFDIFALYQAIPQYARALEHVDHFSWPLIGPIITSIGQIPLDPSNPRQIVKSLKSAAKMLQKGESLTVLPEGSRTLDGSLGEFFPGAFRLAIKAGVPIVPMAIRGGRNISRRGDWRFRPGREEVLFAAPISTTEMTAADAPKLAEASRQCIIELLHGRLQPGHEFRGCDFNNDQK